MSVTLTLELPDDLVPQLSVGGRDLQRAALEAFAVEEYRARRITHAQVGSILGLSRWDVDGLLKEHQVWFEYTVEDFRQDGKDLARLRGQKQVAE